jgi:type IV pilus assembly protein PilB
MPKDIDELKLTRERAEKLNVPFADLSGKIILPNVLKEVSEEAATFYQFVPLEKRGKDLAIGMINPEDMKARDAIRFIAQSRNFVPRIKIITSSDFKNVLKQYRTLKEEVETALGELEKELVARGKDITVKEEETDADALERIMVEAPITKIVAVILRHAQEGRASDIHIEPIEKDLRIRFRVDGLLHTSLILPKNIQSAVVSRIKILSSLKIDETRIPQDGRFRSELGGKKIDFRVSTFPTSYGEKAVLRLLDPSIGLMSLDQLCLVGHTRRVIEEAIEKPFGMLLITGPTGSGKTTTLYAILRVLNDEESNIVSLEDPVEYFIEGVNQSQIKPEINYTFASGLRSILRQDPDIIMVGEVRDSETAELATHAALTGHIVLSTLHTNNALGVIPRLIDMGVQHFLIPSSLRVAMSQRLVRKLCQECRQPIETPAKIKEFIAREIEAAPEETKKDMADWGIKEIKIWQAPGCKFCAHKGTKDRLAIHEALVMTPELEKIIIEGVTEAKLREEAKRQGMVTMKQDGLIKVIQGLTSFEELMGTVEE